MSFEKAKADLEEKGLGAENLRLSLKRQDVVEFCRTLNDNYTDMFGQKNIEYRFEASHDEILLDFDSFKLELIISNLITNAFKYTKKGGKVSFGIEESNDRVIFHISDTAIGLSEQSDAMVLVVSEETGAISIARNGELMRYLTVDDVKDILRNAIVQPHVAGKDSLLDKIKGMLGGEKK